MWHFPEIREYSQRTRAAPFRSFPDESLTVGLEKIEGNQCLATAVDRVEGLTMACDRILASVPNESFISEPSTTSPLARIYPPKSACLRTGQRIKDRGRLRKFPLPLPLSLSSVFELNLISSFLFNL